eukprot:4072955-Lingulodinium_polyedra.AAC.1
MKWNWTWPSWSTSDFRDAELVPATGARTSQTAWGSCMSPAMSLARLCHMSGYVLASRGSIISSCSTPSLILLDNEAWTRKAFPLGCRRLKCWRKKMHPVCCWRAPWTRSSRPMTRAATMVLLQHPMVSHLESDQATKRHADFRQATMVRGQGGCSLWVQAQSVPQGQLLLHPDLAHVLPEVQLLCHPVAHAAMENIEALPQGLYGHIAVPEQHAVPKLALQAPPEGVVAVMQGARSDGHQLAQGQLLQGPSSLTFHQRAPAQLFMLQVLSEEPLQGSEPTPVHGEVLDGNACVATAPEGAPVLPAGRGYCHSLLAICQWLGLFQEHPSGVAPVRSQ